MTIWNVSNASQLQAALTSASGGDEIVLAGGSYGDVNMSGRTYTSELTIKSAVPGMAVLGDLSIPSNVTIDGVEWEEYTFEDVRRGREFNPVDGDKGYKTFARNTGIIIDEDFELVETGVLD